MSSDLVAVRYLISDLKAKAETEEARLLLADVEVEVQTVYDRSRDFTHQLNESNAKEEYNALELVENLTLRFGVGSSLKVQSEVDPLLDKIITSQQNSELYKVVKEAVANCLKHSGATQMEIKVLKQDCEIVFEIKDNGHGMSSEKKAGLGLASMRERVRLLGGDIKIETNTSGFRIYGSFPKTA